MHEIYLTNTLMCLVCSNRSSGKSTAHSLDKGQGSMMQLVALAPDTFSLGNSAHGISSLIPPFIQQTFVCKDSASQREKSSCGFCTNTRFRLGLDEYRYMHIDGWNCYANGITFLLAHQWRKKISFRISPELEASVTLCIGSRFAYFTSLSWLSLKLEYLLFSYVYLWLPWNFCLRTAKNFVKIIQYKSYLKEVFFASQPY